MKEANAVNGFTRKMDRQAIGFDRQSDEQDGRIQYIVTQGLSKH